MRLFLILEKEDVGASFLNWPEEMRFITPSFPAQGFGQTDLNAVVPRTSLAYTLIWSTRVDWKVFQRVRDEIGERIKRICRNRKINA